MPHQKSSIVFTLLLTLSFALTLFALTTNKTGQTGQYSQHQEKSQQTGQESMGTMGMQSEQTISATVEDIDQQQRLITLRPDQGKSIELTVPEAMVSDL